MKYLKRSNYFLNHGYLSESMFYVSDDFKEKIKGIDSPISKELLSVVNTNVKPDMTFVDVADKEGFVKFSQIETGSKSLKDELVDEETGDVFKLDFKSGDWFNEKGDKVDLEIDTDKFINNNFDQVKGGNQVKIGKLINKIFPSKFKDKEIEEFVNLFKSKTSELKNNFKIVKGYDIPRWYNCDSYSEEKGTLGSSCMKNMDDDVFDIYSENESVCGLLILKDEYDDLLGRALVWKIKISNRDLDRNPELKSVEYFMDRIYSIKDSDQNTFIEYANSKGWAYRSKQSYSYDDGIIYKTNFYKVIMEISLEKSMFEAYPYMDTFQSLNQSDNTLRNTSLGPIILDTTDGSIGEWSDYYDERIPTDDGVYSEALDDFLWADRSVYIDHSNNGHEGLYPNDHYNILYDDISGFHIHRDDAVFSEYTGEYYYSENVVNVISGINKGKVTDESWVHDEEPDFINTSEIYEFEWFQKVNSIYGWDDYGGIIDSHLTKDHQGDYIPKFLEVETYSLGDDENEEWLTLTDSFLLGKIGEDEYNSNKSTNDDLDKELLFDYFERVWVRGDNDAYKDILDKEYFYNLKHIKNSDSGFVLSRLGSFTDMIGIYEKFNESTDDKEKIQERIITSFNDFNRI